jgi:hypothetical protein
MRIVGSLQTQSLHDLITILPQEGSANAATAKHEDCYDRDDERGVALLGLIHGGGHLIIHGAFSSSERI